MTTAVAAALLMLFLTTEGLSATTLEGRVTHVIDGDGLVVLVGTRHVIVRLAEIDAPERSQPFGQPSRQSLHALCGGKPTKLEVRGKDRNGRTVAQVTCAGTNANSEQVRRGMAWVFERYAPANSPLYALQAEARQTRRGLWAQSEPVPPWEWRQSASRTNIERPPTL